MKSLDKRLTNGTTILMYNQTVHDTYWYDWYVEGVDDATFQQWVLPPPTRHRPHLRVDPTAVITFNDLYD